MTRHLPLVLTACALHSATVFGVGLNPPLAQLHSAASFRIGLHSPPVHHLHLRPLATTSVMAARAPAPAMIADDLADDTFSAKVLGTVGAQLGVTALVANTVMAPGELHDFALASTFSWALPLATLAGLWFNRAGQSKFFWLGAFTLAESWSIGIACATYADAGLGAAISGAVGFTASDVAVLTAYALTSRSDFSFLGGGLRTALWALLVGSVVEIGSFYSPALIPTVPFQDLALALLGSVVFSLFLAFDVQQMRTRYAATDDYIGAALNIYLDILNLFLDIMRVLGASSSSSKD